MAAYSIGGEHVPAVEQSASGDALVVARVRLVLAASAVLSALTEAAGSAPGAVLALLGAYLALGAAVCAGAEAAAAWTRWRLWHWLDLGWLGLLIAASGGDFPFPFLFFVILSASLRWGFDEGACVTLAAVAGYLAASAPRLGAQLAPVLLKTIFLLALGYLIAQLGEHRLQLQRRFALLRALSGAGNPRLGIDHTVTAMMEHTRAFFSAQQCVLVLRGRDGGPATLRSVGAGSALAVAPEALPEPAAAILLAFPADATLLFGGRRALPLFSSPGQDGPWVRRNADSCARVADLLGGESFISAPVSLNDAAGRVFLVRSAPFTRSDALFLSQVAAQALPVVENMALLDRIASDAAAHERARCALDLHDTAVQPYIGLGLGLAALQRKSTPDNPLHGELAELGRMVNLVIADLRAYAGTMAAPGGADGCCAGALARLVAQMEQRWGLQVLLDVQVGVELGDRLAAEVIQIVREGLNNIARHTAARAGKVSLRRLPRAIQIEIDNAGTGDAAPHFVPKSISTRAAVLGGRTYVRCAAAGTAVFVEIPL
ncbi:MAG: sensor histidine kinase [Telluria sp.]